MEVAPFSGKGLWIRRLTACEQGQWEAIAARAQAAGLTHLLLKIADGADASHNDAATQTDGAADFTRHLREAGIAVWGWHSIYGDKPRFKGAYQPDYHRLEAECALQRLAVLREAGLQGYVLNIEGEYERAPQRALHAEEFMHALRAALPTFPIGLSAWKYPLAHPRFPWAAFRQFTDFDLPRIFWIGKRREAAEQLAKALEQYRALEPRRLFIPVGPAFEENRWRPTPDALREFLEKARALGLPAVNFWAWDSLGLSDFQPHWQVLAEFDWASTPELPSPEAQESESEEAPHSFSETVAESEGELESPDLTAELSAVLTAPEEHESLPDWTHLDAPQLTADDAEPARPFAPEEEAEDEGAPHSFSETVAEREGEPDLTAELSAVLAAPEEHESLPEWTHLDAPQLTADDAEPARPFAPEEPEAEGEPDLTAELSAMLAAPEEHESLPDWTHLDTPQLTADDTEPARPFTPEEPQVEMPEAKREAEPAPRRIPLPEWLRTPIEDVSEIETAPIWPREAEVASAQKPEVRGQKSEVGSQKPAPQPVVETTHVEPPAPEPETLSTYDLPLTIPSADGTQIAPTPINAHSPTASQLFDDLREGHLQEALALYEASAVLIGPGRPAHDDLSRRHFYLWLLPKVERASLTLEEVAVFGQTVTANWACRTRAGETVRGTDTFHLDTHERIIYHHTTLHSGLSP